MDDTAMHMERRPVAGRAMVTTRVALGLAALLLMTGTAAAQTRVKVVQDQTVIWETGFAIVAGTVPAGTELDVVGQRDTWYEVRLPFKAISGRTTGFVAMSRVQLIGGAPPTTPRPAGARPGPARPPAKRFVPKAGARVFGQAGYGRFLAERSFKAVLGQSGGGVYGGGGEFHTSSGAFVQVAAEQFRQTGERVFVLGDEVFPLGVADTITVTPLTLTLGYRGRWRGLYPHVGAGYGAYFFKEISDFAEPSENVKTHYGGYHVLGGIEVGGPWFGTAFEVDYSHVPKAFDGGTAALFDEHNLGAVRVRVKVLFGSAR